MTDQEVYKKIESIYASEKGKGFITHLLRSFYPVNKSFELLDAKDPKEMICSITGKKLVSKADQLKKLVDNSDVLFEDFISFAKSNSEKPYEESTIKQEIREMLVAIACKDSTRLLSRQAFEQLFNFYATQMLKGNKHLNWIAAQERKTEIVKAAKAAGVTESESKVVAKAVFERANMSLGDLEVLQQLKKKFENA